MNVNVKFLASSFIFNTLSQYYISLVGPLRRKIGFSHIKYYPHGKSSIMSASHFELAQMIPVEHPTKPNPLPIFIEGG